MCCPPSTSLMPTATLAKSAFLSCPYPTVSPELLAPQKVQHCLFDLNLYTVDIPAKKKTDNNKNKKKNDKRKKNRKKNTVLRTKNKKGKDSSDSRQGVLFDCHEYYQTEYLLYSLWDGMKKRDKGAFFEAVTALNQYLIDEQFDALMKEIRWHFSLEDKGWLLTVLQGNRIRPFSLLYPCHHQVWGLINIFPHFPYPPAGGQVYTVFYLLVLGLFTWENN